MLLVRDVSYKIRFFVQTDAAVKSGNRVRLEALLNILTVRKKSYRIGSFH